MTTRQELEKSLIARATKDAALRAELLKNPKLVFERETGLPLPAGMDLKVIEERPDTHYVVLPDTEWGEMSDDELAAVAGGRAESAGTQLAAPFVPGGAVLSAKGRRDLR